MPTIAVVNEKGGTGKTTTAVSLSAALARRDQRVLLVDLDGQAAASRWLGVEEDHRLADAIVAGGGLQPIPTAVANLHLAPSSGRLDSIAHDLRPTQGGQLRRVLGEVSEQFDYIVIDCPPSLGNRLIGNALLAASHALVPVETSILALDGLGIVLTTLNDIREGFGHDIRLIGAVGCRYDARTRLSRLVMKEMRRALPRHVFATAIRANVKLQECPATGLTIFDYDARGSGSADYDALAGEVLAGGPAATSHEPRIEEGDYDALDADEQRTLNSFRHRAASAFAKPSRNTADDEAPADGAPSAEAQTPPITPLTLVCDDVDEDEGEAQAPSQPLVAQASADTSPEPASQQEADEAGLPMAQLIGPDDGEAEAAPAAPSAAKSRKPQMAALAVALVLIVAIVAFVGRQMSGGPQSAQALPTTPITDVMAAASTAPATPEQIVEAEVQLLPPADTALSVIDSLSNAQPVELPDEMALEPIEAQPQDELVASDIGPSIFDAPTPVEPAPTIADEPAPVETASAETPATTTDSKPIVIYAKPRKLTLGGTIRNASGGMAIINGQTVQVGQRINGATLVAVDTQRAELEFAGQTHTLMMGKPLTLSAAGNDQP